jgi:subtilase family serine protease
VCGYTPGQLRSAYGLDTSRLSGRGQTIAEAIPASTSLEQDVDTWSTQVGAQPLRPGQLTVIGSPDGSGTPVADSDLLGIESTLDVEAMHGIAPDADIIAIGADTENWASVVDTYAYIEDHDVAGIVNTSAALFESPGMMAVYDQVFQEGALQGIGFYFSTGDTGNYAWPASSSWATGVGGTALAIGANGKRLWETGWGDEQASLSADQSAWGALGPSNGAGGGKVARQPQPWYQRGVVPSSLATGTDGTLDRVGADVAMDADGRTGMLVGGKPLDVTGNGTTYTETRIGGTSLSSPLFTGVQALAQQAAHHRMGFANPEIYERYDTPSFRDITKYTLPDGSYPAEAAQPLFTNVWDLYVHQGRVPASVVVPTPPDTRPGYDEVTGIGVPTADYLRSFR